MKKETRATLNTLSVVLVLGVNYYAQTGAFGGQTIGEVSDRYSNLFTPAGYAFAIWGIIFMGLMGYVIYQSVVVFKQRKDREEYQRTGFWFALVNTANASWVLAWLYDYTGLSVLIMLFMLIGLMAIIIKTDMERWDAPLPTIVFIWWPICLYVGWIAVATIANVAAYLSKLNWNGSVLTETAWTIVMIVVATVLNSFMIWKRNMREFGLVGVWALAAIYVRHQEGYPSIAWVALLAAIFLVINVGIHGYLNRATNPFKKLTRNYF